VHIDRVKRDCWVVARSFLNTRPNALNFIIHRGQAIAAGAAIDWTQQRSIESQIRPYGRHILSKEEVLAKFQKKKSGAAPAELETASGWIAVTRKTSHDSASPWFFNYWETTGRVSHGVCEFYLIFFFLTLTSGYFFWYFVNLIW
jgi:hypothetical protein